MFTFKAAIATVPCDLTWDTLPAASQLFLAEYGLRQYLSDGAAVPLRFTSGERKGEAKTEAEIAEEKRDGVQARLDNILSGEFTRRTAAPKQTREERIRAEVVLERLTTAAKAANVKLPPKTGKNADPDKLTELCSRYYAKYRGEVDKIVKRHLAEAQETVDLSDIFA